MTILKIDRTADEFRAMARERWARKDASFESCDTDGFLSQWGAEQMALRYELAATIADNGGEHDFLAIFDLDGNMVPAKMVQTTYGSKFLVLDNWDGVYEYGKGNAVTWLPLPCWDDGGSMTISERSRKALAKKGYRYGYVSLPAVVLAKGDSVLAVPQKDARYEDGRVVIVY